MSTPKQAERNHRMLQTARHEFCQKGYREASIDVIAKKAMVSKATLYHHFDNKETLFVAVFEYAINQIELKIFPSFSKTSNVHERIKTGLRLFMKDTIENPEFNFFFKALTVDNSLITESLRKKIIGKFFASGLIFSRRQIKKEQEAGAIKSHFDPDFLFNGVLGMIYYILIYWERNQRRISIEKCADQITEIITYGLSTGEKA